MFLDNDDDNNCQAPGPGLGLDQPGQPGHHLGHILLFKTCLIISK